MPSAPPIAPPAAPASVPPRAVVRRTPGEAMVWLTGMGLSVCMMMVIGLLFLVLCNGLAVFWPDRVTEIAIRDASGTTSLLAGVVVRDREKAAIGGGASGHELQLFTGNKDVYNLPYRFVDAGQVVESRQPADVMVVERLEHGPLIGYPVALVARDGSGRLAAGDAGFAARLAEWTETTERLRREIHEVGVGRYGSAIKRLDKALARLRRQGSDEGVAALEAERQSLMQRSDELGAQVAALRRQLGDRRLVMRLATGEERTIQFGTILDTWHPNRLGTGGQAVRFLGNMWAFVSENPRAANTEGGVFPAIFGTLLMTVLMSAFVVPFGVVAAIYLREYAKQGLFVRMVRIAVNNLAGVPSIVFGVFGVGFFVYFVGGGIDRWFFSDDLPNPTFGTGGILWASLTLALMTVPVVIVATEEAIAAVPRGAREGSLACGASKWQTIQRIILPASLPGILTGLILAMARGAGEVAPLMLVGVVKLTPVPIDGTFPFIHFDQKFMHLGFHIYDLGFQSPDSEAARPMVFATTMLLILMVLALNLGAILLRERLRRRYATSAF